MADFKAMLDELMGKDRNLLPHERTKAKKHFSDREICKNFLAKLCFTELFPKTKMDLGPCPFAHDDQMKEMWEACPDKDRYSYERDFLAECNRMISECDGRTRRLKAKYREDSMKELKDQLQETMKKMEEFGEVGKVEESLALNVRKEKIEEQLAKLRDGSDDLLLMIPGTQKNVVPCDNFFSMGNTFVYNNSGRRVVVCYDHSRMRKEEMVEEDRITSDVRLDLEGKNVKAGGSAGVNLFTRTVFKSDCIYCYEYIKHGEYAEYPKNAEGDARYFTIFTVSRKSGKIKKEVCHNKEVQQGKDIYVTKHLTIKFKNHKEDEASNEHTASSHC